MRLELFANLDAKGAQRNVFKFASSFYNFFQKYFVLWERQAFKYSFNTYIRSNLGVLIWSNLYCSRSGACIVSNIMRAGWLWSLFQLQITASVSERPLWATWVAASDREPTLSFATEADLSARWNAHQK